MTKTPVRSTIRKDGVKVRAHERRTAQRAAGADPEAASDAAAAAAAGSVSGRALSHETKTAARDQLHQVCESYLDLSDPQYGAANQDCVDRERLNDLIVLAETFRDEALTGDVFMRDYRVENGIEALGNLRYYADIEHDAKTVYSDIAAITDQDPALAGRAVRLADYALSGLSESGGPLDETVRHAQRCIPDMSSRIADLIVRRLDDEHIQAIADSDNPEQAAKTVIDDAIRAARSDSDTAEQN